MESDSHKSECKLCQGLSNSLMKLEFGFFRTFAMNTSVKRVYAQHAVDSYQLDNVSVISHVADQYTIVAR